MNTVEEGCEKVYEEISSNKLVFYVVAFNKRMQEN